MNTLADLLNLVITTLQSRPVCRSTRVLETHSFSARQFALKVRAELIAGGVLQVRLYCNGDHTDYAYHLIHGEQSVRWDNKEHFDSIPTFPHHFHAATGRVEPSPLTGDPAHDLVIVLDHLSHLARG